MGSNSMKTPKSPWMPFSMLFAAISNKVPSKDMEHIYMQYEQFRVILNLNLMSYFFSCLFMSFHVTYMDTVF